MGNILRHKEKAIFIAAVIILAIITIIFGYTGYSLNGYLDSIFFIPPAVSFAIGQGFVNPVTDLRSAWGDPIGHERYLYFPPLFPLLISAFILESISLPPSQQALLGAGILSALAVILASLVFYKIATLRGKKFDFLSAMLICAALLIILRASWGFIARPETLEGLLVAVGFLIAFYVRRPWQVVAGFAVLLGLMAATHPFGAVFFALLAGLFFSFFHEWRRSIIYIVATYLLAFVAFLLVMQISPYSISDTFVGVFRHGSLVLQRLDISNAVVFLGSPYTILYGIIMAFLAAFCAHFCFRHRKEIKTFFLFALFAACIAGLMVYFVLISIKTYYAALFSIFVFSALVYYLIHSVNVRLIKYATLLFLVFLAMLSLRPVLAFPSFVKHGVTIAAAREKFKAVAARHPDADIFIAASLWVLSEDYERMHYIGDITPGQKARRPLVVLLDQNHSYGNWSPAADPPAEAEGCPLKENYFVDKVPRFLGVKLSNAMPGYGFAVYECE